MVPFTSRARTSTTDVLSSYDSAGLKGFLIFTSATAGSPASVCTAVRNERRMLVLVSLPKTYLKTKSLVRRTGSKESASARLFVFFSHRYLRRYPQQEYTWCFR